MSYYFRNQMIYIKTRKAAQMNSCLNHIILIQNHSKYFKILIFFIKVFTLDFFIYRNHSFQYREESKDNLESKNNSMSNYSSETGKDENNCCSGGSIFNDSSISIIKEQLDISQTTDHGITKQLDEIYTYVKDINSQLKWLTERQQKIDNDVISSSLSKSDICKSIETTLTSTS